MNFFPVRFLISFVIASCLANNVRSQDIEDLKLKDYRPKSVFKIPISQIKKAKYPVIDVHTHDYAKTPEEVKEWVSKMDSLGIQRTIVLTGKTGAAFDEIAARYLGYPDRFDVWCGFDFADFDQSDWIKKAIAELERCHKVGAKGVGEVTDKGKGINRSGMHVDDPRLKPLLEKCASLGMPVNVHVADPYWAYLPMDSTNDGLMSAYRWRIDLSQEGILNHGRLIETLENAIKNNPRTTFIACHLANCDFDLSILGNLFDRYANLYADISARYYQTATIPRQVRVFYNKYSDRLLYGTDMSTDINMYRFTLRILESADEHFYFRYTYHWPLYGLDLNNKTLKRIYNGNAKRILKQ